VSGALTFAAGETTKIIDVHVRGESTIEGNETFFVTLRNAVGATLQKPSAFAIIEDDDRTADVSLGLDFSAFDPVAYVFITAANSGPSMATNLDARITATPQDSTSGTCLPCEGFSSELAPGASLRAGRYHSRSFQQYLTATVTGRESDPNPSNNSVGWIAHQVVAMDALFLTPGAAANVWFDTFYAPAGVSVESSDPSVLSIPSSVVTTPDQKPVSFVARGVGVGTSTIRVFTPERTVGTLAVDVLAPGTQRRWPGAINVFVEQYSLGFDDEAAIRIDTTATAPFNGEPPTGAVSIRANEREVGRVNLTPDVRFRRVPFHVAEIGTNTIAVAYAGDANFLPMTETFDIVASRGSVTISGSGDRNGTAATIRVRVTGSPMASPTGTITVGEPGIIPSVEVPLTPGAYGDAQASVTLTNVDSGPHTLVLNYSGDTRYQPATQSLRIHTDRRRGVRH